MRLEIARAVAISNPLTKIKSPGWAVLTGVCVMTIYLLLLPFIDRTWRTTGDEPHYLLAAHSLATDLDFDLTNNYDRLDYLNFYYSRDIERQIRTNQAGQQILNHQPALPVLIAPAYALAGHLGVLTFQVLLGGLLAMLTFKLAVVVSGDERAACLATLAVALSPPLLMYHYLVYPELIGAFLTTLVLYLTLAQNKPTAATATLVLLSLIILTWLNRRFIPLALLLACLIVWAWRNPDQELLSSSIPLRLPSGLKRILPRLGRPTLTGLTLLLATLLSIVLLLWYNSQFDQPVQADITIPADATVVWSRLERGIGWLVDQQRGLFVFAPIYILTLWGLPGLIRDSLAYRSRNWFVLLPGLLSLGVTALAAGFWVAWELGPRFLVVALPALAPLLALAWRDYHRYKLWLAAAVLLLGLSLAHSWIIIQNPELPYKSSLPLYYAEKFGLPLTEFLPDLAGYARISAAAANPQADQVVLEDGRPLWFAEAGRSTALAQSDPLYELPFGHYQLTWPVRVEPGLPPETELMRISAKLSGGGSVFNKTVTAAELPADGRYGLVRYKFLNPNVDRWRTPLVLHAVSTGHSRIWGQDILLTPDPFYDGILPYLYLTILAGGAFLTWYLVGRSDHNRPTWATKPLPVLPKWAAWMAMTILLLAAFGYLLYQHNRSSHTYDAINLYHFVGQPLTDPAAVGDRTWLVDPAIDPPQKATYGPFEIYDPGRYQVTFRMKLTGPVEPDQEIARLQVNATANFEPLLTQPLRSEHFSKPNLYHDFVLTVTNPRRQALSFDVYYLGVAALAIDEITITRIEDFK